MQYAWIVGKIGLLAASLWGTLCAMAPWLLLGFLVAGVLSVLVDPKLVERHLGGRGLLQVFKAALFGVPLPLCSCGVIPVAVSLRRHGASRGATTAFLLSTPQTGVDNILVTYSLLGPLFALFCPIATLATGLIGGWLVDLCGGDDDARASNGMGACDGPCCSLEPRRRRKWVDILQYGFVTLPRDIARAMLLGLVVAAGISAFVPNDLFAGFFGTGFSGMLIILAVSIPLYVCSTASVPVAAALMEKGISAGAAFVFLVAGPVTNAAGIAAVWKIMGRRTALIYLAAVVVCALGFGLLLNQLMQLMPGGLGAPPPPLGHHHTPGWLESVSGVVLLLVLGAGLFGSARVQVQVAAGRPAEQTLRLRVTGMTCSHCVETVGNALGACAGVAAVEVDLKAGAATVRGHNLRSEDLTAAVAAQGFEARVEAT